MNTVFAALVALATVSATPFLLDHHLVTDKGHEKLAVFHHVGHVVGTGANATRLRFVHLMPKFTHLGAFDEGFGSVHGSTVRHHKFVHLEGGDKLVELLGLSDCHKWHATLLGVWNPHVGHLVHKPYGGVKGEPVKVLGGLDELVNFVHLHFDADHYKVFGHLLRLGLTSHLFTHKLLVKLGDGLKVHTA